MNKITLIQSIRNLANEIKPFTQNIRSGSKTWDGNAYVQAEPRQADPYALMWWSVLTTIAELLDAQESELSSRQVKYLRERLLGGMGSLADYSVDTGEFGESARIANEQLDRQRTMLFKIFSE